VAILDPSGQEGKEEIGKLLITSFLPKGGILFSPEGKEKKADGNIAV